MLRIVKGRTLADYLFVVARRTTLVLIVEQALILSIAWYTGRYHLSALLWWYLLVASEFVVSIILLSSTLRHLKTTKPPMLSGGYADKDLPSLTVAIPARNETLDLTECLDSLIASTYPKLEILVLDDCSQNKRTPEIIRSFAHAGVRFVAGQTPPDNWLAKNFAYEQLVNQSNGELILFCGVDARFEPDSLKVIVETLIQKKKTMFSIIPANRVLPAVNLEALLVQPSRYAWELSLPRRWLNRPAVLSTCWLVSRSVLTKAGTFKAVTRAISPESYFARQASQQSDGYSFIQSDTRFGVTCVKAFSEQRATAIRTRYPQLHRRPEMAAFLSISLLLSVVAPYGILVTAAVNRQSMLAVLALLVVIILSSFYGAVVQLTYRTFLLRGIWLLPFAGLYDVALLNYSLWKYEFSEVVWKGRNVCVPVMRTISHLPKI